MLETSTEVPIGLNRADIQMADGRIVEFQTTWLPYAIIKAREAAYGDMAWIYRITSDMTDLRIMPSDAIGSSDVKFHWMQPRRSVLAHERPMYWHRSDESIWSIKTLFRSTTTTSTGATVWEGTASQVGTDWYAFAEQLTNGMPFEAPTEFYGFDALERRRSFALIHGDHTFDMDDIDLSFEHMDRASKHLIDRQLVVDPSFAAHFSRMQKMPRCSYCGRPMVAGQPGMHFTCAAYVQACAA